MIETLYGLQVADDALYTAYRAEMTPLLETYGGRFVVDVRVQEVLRTPGEKVFNRLFTIRFPSPERMTGFFADPAYLAIRQRFFEPSVAHFETLGRYEVLA
jgi:uncharacterized protein (DUF1330 family)